jgi:hypothetical protein
MPPIRAAAPARSRLPVSHLRIKAGVFGRNLRLGDCQRRREFAHKRRPVRRALASRPANGPFLVHCQRSLWPIVAGWQTPINAGLRPPPTAADGIDRGLPASARCHHRFDGKVCANFLVGAVYARILAAADSDQRILLFRHSAGRMTRRLQRPSRLYSPADTTAKRSWPFLVMVTGSLSALSAKEP